jgi:hypothetical protein
MLNEAAKSRYLENLRENADRFQLEIEGLLEKYEIQPVGTGYIDLILERGKTAHLVQELARLPVAVHYIAWWCHCTPESKLSLGCPHGAGGPPNRLGLGWYSECIGYPDFDVTEHGIQEEDVAIEPQALADQCRELICKYFANVLPNESFYSPCLHPGLWLHVPEGWERKHYQL